MATFTYVPNGDGTHTQWTPLGGGLHYVEVDEIPHDGNTTRVDETTNNQRDSYQVTNSGAELVGATINHIRVYHAGICIGAFGSRVAVRPLIITHATEYYGTQVFYIWTGYSTFNTQWNTNPFTGLAWTQAEIDNIEIGIQKRQATNQARMTHEYLYVDYTPAPSGKVYLLNGWCADRP